MIIWQSIIEALESLSANKLRSGLTIIGIVIGVAAVIAVISIGQGAQSSITGSIEGIGTNLVFVFRNNSRDIINPKPLTLSDAQQIGDPLLAPDVGGVAPVIQGTVTATAGRETTDTTLFGITPDYATVRNASVSEGEFISQENILGRASVALIGTQTADTLLGRHEGVTGETIRINNQPFRIIGVLTSKGGSGFGNQDDQIMVPLTTAQSRLLSRPVQGQIDQISVSAVSPSAVPLVVDQISQILRSRHRTAIGADDFRVLTQQDILSTVQSVTGVLTIFLGGIAAISLLVGGIGIMNIMLVSVTERTREIGLRKALGARRIDILVQFLTESALLSLFGGLIGTGLGVVISEIVSRVAKANNAQINPTIGLKTVLLATLFSAAVGLFFGAYPANRAASLEPVEALRYE